MLRLRSGFRSRISGGANVDDWISQIETALTIEFEIFAPGHGSIGTKDDLEDALGYLKDLRAAVLEGLKANRTVDQLKTEVTMDAYSEWGQYDSWRELNVEGMAGYLEGTGLAN